MSNYILYEFLTKYEMDPIYVPFNGKNYYERDPALDQCILLASKDIKTNPKCLILIQGAGHVKLGLWSNSVTINEGINLGSMIPFVELAKKYGYSILIMNPNERFGLYGKNKNIFFSMKEHCSYVYKNLVYNNGNIKKVYFISHSLGSECNVEILKEFEEDLLKGRFRKIAFTDGCHGGAFLDLSKAGIEIFTKISRNFVASIEEKGKFLKDLSEYYGCEIYSSGTNQHEYTTGVAIDIIFEFLNGDK